MDGKALDGQRFQRTPVALGEAGMPLTEIA